MLPAWRCFLRQDEKYLATQGFRWLLPGTVRFLGQDCLRFENLHWRSQDWNVPSKGAYVTHLQRRYKQRHSNDIRIRLYGGSATACRREDLGPAQAGGLGSRIGGNYLRWRRAAVEGRSLRSAEWGRAHGKFLQEEVAFNFFILAKFPDSLPNQWVLLHGDAAYPSLCAV